MTLKLRPYQIEDAKKLISQDNTACFNEQRTGKTPTALETLKLRDITDKRVLIITTASSLYQWQEEYNRWLKKPCIVCTGTLTKRRKLITQWTHGLVISLDSLKETQRSPGVLKDILKMKPICVILDEAHKIKTPTTASAKTVYKLRSIKYKLALTGTPAPNKAYDVFSILKFLFPQEYTSFYKFKEDYFDARVQTIYVNGRARTFANYDYFKKGKQLALQRELDKFSTVRKRIDVMPWLPQKDYERVKLPATKEQLRYLQDIKRNFKVGKLEIHNTLESMMRTRQICLDPGLLDLKGKSPKTDYIIQYLKDYPNEPLIIFSKFTTYLVKLFELLKNDYRIGMIIGDTPAKLRETYKKDFQNGLYNIILINIDAGKEALTLDRAETVIFTDKYPPIGDILQAEDRFIATTKDKKDKPHKIVELMITDTFDAQIYDLLEKRLSETDVINNYKKYLEGVKQ